LKKFLIYWEGRVIFPAGNSHVECEMKKIIVNKEEKGADVVLTFRFKALGQLLDEEGPAPLPE